MKRALTSLALACALGCSQPEAQPAAPASSILHVLDDATGEELDRVQLEYGVGYPSPTLATPGRTSMRTSWSGSSPVDLEPLAETLHLDEGMLRVGAVGYAWQHLVVHPDSPTELTVRLKPGANLFVDIVFPEHPETLTAEGAHWNLHIVAMDDPVAPRSLNLSALASDEDRYVLEGFVPGRYRAEVHFTRPDQNQILASWAADLTLNETARILLYLDEPEELVRAPLTITVKDSSGWLPKDQPLLLFCTSEFDDERSYILDHPQPFEGMPQFEDPAVLVGAYSAALISEPEGQPPSVFVTNFELEPDGLDILWQLPKPIELTLKIVEVETGQPLGFKSLAWGSDQSDSSLPQYVIRQSSTKVLTEDQIMVVPGPTFFALGDREYGILNPTQEITASMTELTLEATRGIPVPLVLDTGGRAIDEAFIDFLFEAIDIDGPSGVVFDDSDAPALSLIAYGTGTYTLRLDATDHIEAAGPFELTVEEGTNQPFKLRVSLKP